MDTSKVVVAEEENAVELTQAEKMQQSLELMKSIFSQSGREYPLGDMTVDDFEREYDLILKKSCKMSSRKRALVVDFMDIFIK
jgi:hypothetical protein